MFLQGKRISSHELGHISNAVDYGDEIHGTEEEVYAWIGNKLANIDNLHDVAFKLFEGIVKEVRHRRDRKNAGKRSSGVGQEIQNSPFFVLLII